MFATIFDVENMSIMGTVCKPDQRRQQMGFEDLSAELQAKRRPFAIDPDKH